MPTLPVDDVELYYEWHGNPAGPVVVFVNGLLTDLASWAGHLPFFTDRYHCLVYDCRGQGQSAKPDHVYTIRRHSADLAGLLAALGIARAAIVGLSNGGATALDFAAAQPARVTALVVALRRAHDLADAIDARGGFGVVSDSQSRPGPGDAVAMLIVAGVALAALFG